MRERARGIRGGGERATVAISSLSLSIATQSRATSSCIKGDQAVVRSRLIFALSLSSSALLSHSQLLDGLLITAHADLILISLPPSLLLIPLSLPFSLVPSSEVATNKTLTCVCAAFPLIFSLSTFYSDRPSLTTSDPLLLLVCQDVWLPFVFLPWSRAQ